MTALTVARESLYQAFVDGWQDETPYVCENEDPGQQDAAWVRFSVRHGEANQETLGATGNRRFRRQGAVFVQIFTSINTGLERADELAVKARDIFEGKTIDGIHFYGVSTTELGPDDQWNQVTVEAPFTYYTQK